jgi:hypothetical protein
MPNRLFSKLASQQTFNFTAVVVVCLIAVPVQAGVSNELFKITPSDISAVDLFGWNVAISGNIAIVGAHGDDEAGNFSGSAYLFDVTTGQQLRKLTASDAAANAVFGSSVAIAGNIAIVGAPSHSNGVGSAYLFDVATGHELFKLSASAPALRGLGLSVAISGNIAVVGAPSDDHAGVGSGSTYLFDVTTGQQLAKLTASDASANSVFGASVAISGNTALIGAPFDDDIGEKAGSAYLFDVTTHQQLAKLTPSDGAPAFGGSVAISGNMALVGGGSRLDCCGSDAGSAYLFDVATRQELAKITPSDGNAGDEFGDSVAISGNTAIVGAFRHDGLAGSAYLFDVTAGRELTKVTASDAEANDSFGFAVAISGNTAIVGSIGGEFGAADRFGAAYVFSAVPEPAGPTLLALSLPLLVCRNSLRNFERRIP